MSATDRHARSRLLAAAALIVALAAFPLGALASHDFPDVPDSNIFHADISALADSGVTTGCGGGNFCPSAFVTREQMAAFMNRLGALAPEKTPVVNADRVDGLDSTQLARTDQTQHFSCFGGDMAPLTSDVTYATTAGYRYSTSGDISFSCAVHLPDGATVTGFAGDVYDNTASQQTTCSLWRIDADGNGGQMAATPGSGAAATPLYTTLATATILTPDIDNAQYAYTASCYLYGGAGSLIRLVKVTVTYTGAP
ncbi:MAG TPA: S-layer homology domain-containing protein [Candidatus Limnocylindria bacterium]|nr:S-layer homology domain-containing protein [Candidatus Limnocylindria bacterium]